MQRLAAAVLATVLIVPTVAPAQVARGTVTMRGTGAPVTGVLLELVDSTSNRVAVALSDARGAFFLRAGGPGTYRIEARRIGFRRNSFGPFVLTADTSVVLALSALPQALPPVTAIDVGSCRQDADEASATAVLWESARTALLSTSVTLRGGGLEFDVASQQRSYTLRRTMLTDVDVDFARVQDVRPWTSLPAAELEQLGFVHLTKDRLLQFVAPDLEVLTSPAFVDTHCFRLNDDGGDRAAVGLEFSPIASIDHADVRGTLWLDRTSLELRSLEFAFAGLHFAGHDSLAGGRIGFTRLEGGGWVPTEWVIRSPMPPQTFIDAVARRGMGRLGIGQAVALSPLDPRWDSRRVTVTGQAILALREAGSVDTAALWRRPLGQLDLTVRWRRGNRGPARGARVVLAGLGATAYADADGRVTFRDIPPGDYLLDVTTDLQDLMRLPRDVETIHVEAGEVTSARLGVLPAINAINSVCAFNGDRAIVGGVVMRDGIPRPWVRIRVARVEVTEDGTERLDHVRSTSSRDGGRFHLCRIPRGARMRVFARFEDGTTQQQDVFIPALIDGVDPVYLVRADFGVGSAPPEFTIAGGPAGAGMRFHGSALPCLCALGAFP